MAELIHVHSAHVTDDESGRSYVAYTFGEERSDGTWGGWLEFRTPDDAEGLRTGQETSQPDRAALEYWAAGLEPIYLDGALDRAKRYTRSHAARSSGARAEQAREAPRT